MSRKTTTGQVTVLDNSHIAVQQAIDELLRLLQKMVDKANAD